MRTKVTINEEKLCNEYVNGNLGTETLAAKYHIGKLKVREILKKHNITPKKRGGQYLNIEFKVKDWKIEKYPEVKGKHYIIIDKRNGFTTTDINNRGGVLTTHIEKTYGVETPTLYDRRMYYMTTGNYWWEQWFDVKLVDDRETKKCPYCDWETVDVDNKSGMFGMHLLKVHHIDKFQYLTEHPEDRMYFATANPIKNRQMETNPDKYVICKVCGEKFARIDNHHLKKHGLTKHQYIKLYRDTELSSKEYHKHQSELSIQNNMNMTFTRNSKAETVIKDFIESGGLNCVNDRHILNGKEIDIFIPEKKIGIEYNGNKWHTEWFGKKNRHYHLSKLEECNKKGVKLISIFEDEYEFHKEIVLSKIAHILNIKTANLKKIYARKCKVKEIYSYQSEEFLEKHHIQGFAKSTLHIGAFYEDRLVGVMSFSNHPGNNWELTRFASDNNYICCGIGGKLFKYFTRNYEYNEIKSFADRRWTVDEKNNIYTKLGFKFVKFTKPNFSYYNPSIERHKRFHKFTLRKDRILNHHPEINPNMTEVEIAKSLGYDRIWDCGLIKYIYKNPNYL